MVRGIFDNLFHFIDFVKLIVILRLFLWFWKFFNYLIREFSFFNLCLVINGIFITLTVDLLKHMFLINIKLWWHVFFFWRNVPKWIFWFLIYTSFLRTLILCFFFVYFHQLILFYDVLFKFKGFLWCTIVIVFIVLYIVFYLLLINFLGF